MMQEQRTHQHVIAFERRPIEGVMDEETHLDAALPGVGLGVLDGDGTEIAAFELQRHAGTLGDPP